MINTIFILLNSAKKLAKVVVSIYISTSSMTISVVQISSNRRLKFFVNVMDVKWFFYSFNLYIFIFSEVGYLFIFPPFYVVAFSYTLLLSPLSFVCLFLIALWKFFIPLFLVWYVSCKHIFPDWHLSYKFVYSAFILKKVSF